MKPKRQRGGVMEVMIEQYRSTTCEANWPRMRPGAYLVTVAELQREGDEEWWIAYIEGHPQECGSGDEIFSAIANMREYVEEAIPMYCDEPDENLTSDAIDTNSHWAVQGVGGVLPTAGADR